MNQKICSKSYDSTFILPYCSDYCHQSNNELGNFISLAEVAGNWNCEFWPATVKILTLASYSLVKHCGMLKCVIEVWEGYVEGWAEDGPRHYIMSCTCAAYMHLNTLIFFDNLAGTQFEVDTKRWIILSISDTLMNGWINKKLWKGITTFFAYFYVSR